MNLKQIISRHSDNGHGVTEQLKESDAKLTASLRGVVYGPGPRPFKRSELRGVLALIFLVLAALIIAAGFGG